MVADIRGHRARLKSTTVLSLRAFLQTPHAAMPDLQLSRDETHDLDIPPTARVTNLALIEIKAARHDIAMLPETQVRRRI
jgi:hypothetical protein